MLGWDARGPQRFGLFFTPHDEDVVLRSVYEDKVPVQVGGEILPLLAGWLDNKEAVVFLVFFVFEGNSLQDLLDAGGSLFVRKLTERAAIQGHPGENPYRIFEDL